MFETASAAMRAMQPQLPHAASLPAAVLASVSIAQPLVMGVAQATTLCCTIHSHEGHVSVSSMGKGPQVIHMTAQAGEHIHLIAQ